ncbi:MAG: hypothetical protein ABI348_07315 [Nitrososphaera sp.]
MIKRYFIVLTLVILILANLSLLADKHHAYACTCVSQESTEQTFQKSVAVFTGKIVSIKPIDKSSHPSVETTFTVNKAWKGVPENQGAVIVTPDDLSCGYGFQENREYLVYANGGSANKTLDVGMCLGTKPVELAEGDMRILGTGYVVQEIPTAEQVKECQTLGIQPDTCFEATIMQKKSEIEREQNEINNLLTMMGLGVGFAAAGVFAFAYIKKKKPQHL